MRCHLGFRVWVLGFRFYGLAFGVRGKAFLKVAEGFRV